MWMIAAYTALGLLIGQLVGLSASSVTSAVLGLLFAFGGGSALALLRGASEDERRGASQAILALSVACTAGLYVGILVSERQLLTPRGDRDRASVAAERKTVADRKYVRGDLVELANAIDLRLANQQITHEEACVELSARIEHLAGEAKAIEHRRASRTLGARQAYSEILQVITGDDR